MSICYCNWKNLTLRNSDIFSKICRIILGQDKKMNMTHHNFYMENSPLKSTGKLSYLLILFGAAKLIKFPKMFFKSSPYFSIFPL